MKLRESLINYLKVSISTYFEKDEEGLFRIKKEPFGKCPFLHSDNSCKIYEIRPDTCKHGSCENDLLVLSVKKAIEDNNTKIIWSEGDNYFKLLNIFKS